MRKPKVVYNGLHKMIKPESFNKDELLAFSYNPIVQPAITPFGKVKLDTYEQFNETMIKNLKFRFAEVDVCIEVSSNGRLHFHGYIHITSIVDFILYDLVKLKETGSYEIDTISDQSVWDQYIYKCQTVMQEYCSRKGIIYRIKQ